MADKDFVVKNGLAVNGSILVVNTGTNSVGINTTSPDATFKVVGTANVTANVTIGGTLTVTGGMIGTANNANNLGGVVASSYALKTYADAAAATAYSNGATYADGRAATAYSNAASYADSRAATAFSNAVATAASQVPSLTSNATTYVLGGGSVTTNTFTVGTTIYSVANGNIGFGVAAPSVKLDVSGAINATGDITSASDLRLKTSIEKIENALDKVCKLNGVTFRMKDSDKRSTGLIAQDVREVMPEAVSTNEEYLSVAYGNLMGLIVEAIKELKAEIDTIKYANKD